METGTLGVLWVLFGAASLLSLALGIVLTYHWFNYSTNVVIPFVATMLYTAVCLTLLISLLALALSV